MKSQTIKLKKWIIGFAIATIISIIAAIAFFLSGNNATNLLSKVPANATSVIVIDLKSISAKLFIDELTSNEKNADKIVELVPDSLIDADWSKSGIELFNRVILFTTKDETKDTFRLNLLLPLSNGEDFNKFIDRLSHSIKLEIKNEGSEKTAYSEQYRILISWNRHFVIASLLCDNQMEDRKFLSKILLGDDESSIMNDSTFAKNMKADFDIIGYALPSAVYPKKYSYFIHENIESVSSFASFNDGELVLEMSIKPKQNSLLNQLFLQPKNEFASIISSDSCSLNAHFNMNPTFFFDIVEKYSSIKLNEDKIPALLAWDGRANILVNGSKIIVNEYISYEYDDDFNKQEIKKTGQEKIIDIQAYLGINQTILDSFYKTGKVSKSKNDTLLFKGSSFLLKKSVNGYLCYNKFIERPKVMPATEKENVLLYINYKPFLQMLKENNIVMDSSIYDKFALDKLEINIIKKNGIALKSRACFTDKQKNALFSIAEKFE